MVVAGGRGALGPEDIFDRMVADRDEVAVDVEDAARRRPSLAEPDFLPRRLDDHEIEVSRALPLQAERDVAGPGRLRQFRPAGAGAHGQRGDAGCSMTPRAGEHDITLACP